MVLTDPSGLRIVWIFYKTSWWVLHTYYATFLPVTQFRRWYYLSQWLENWHHPLLAAIMNSPDEYNAIVNRSIKTNQPFHFCQERREQQTSVCWLQNLLVPDLILFKNLDFSKSVWFWGRFGVLNQFIHLIFSHILWKGSSKICEKIS